MTDIMKLAEAFADACADVREFLGANAGMNEADGTWIASQQARTALQSAITSMQAENEQLKREIESQYRCIKSHAQVTQKAEAERDTMREAHRKLIRAYVNLLESGRDRIISLGGTCDPVDQMEAGDPALREAKEALTAANSVTSECSKVTSEYSEQPQAQGGASGFTEAQFDQALSERDHYHEVADDLAAQIAAITGQDIGEHSSANSPWHNAMLAADEFIAQQLRDLLTHPQATEPAGYKLVPVEPTPEMREAGLNQLDTLNADPTRLLADRAYFIYRAMLAAAPKQPTNNVQE